MNTPTRRAAAVALLVLLCALPALAGVTNGDFESGDFSGWVADPNWVVVDNSCGYYAGWGGKYWAWSGGKGEPAMGVLKSKPFVLDKPAVRMLISGWGSMWGTGQPRHWNYVTLNLEDGTEVDRVWAPDGTNFVPAYLDGSRYVGRRVYVQAVDDADQPSFSMLCIDDVRTAQLPADFTTPAPVLPAFDPARSLVLENADYRVEVSRANGSLTRLRDKRGGLELIAEPRLAASFVFSLVIPGKEPWQALEANWIRGPEQKLTSFSLQGDRLRLRWSGPLRNYLGESYPVGATMTIRLTAAGVLLDLDILNRSPYPVGETYFPVFAGLQGLGRTRGELRATQLVRPAGTPPEITTTAASIFQVFANAAPFGDQGPEQFYACPANQPSPWVAFSAPRLRRCALIGARDPLGRDLVARFMLNPASSGTARDDGNWPRPEELHGLPVGVELSFVDTAVHAPGRGYHAAPVLVQFLDAEPAALPGAFAAWPRP
jgi:hypothetical protein